ncbi:ABC transporter permease [Oscillibacter sp.]|uniref:ABC transporter permease n=1 Tax=Oscillibacter sp. TaxID=1945593 RepID=UPI0028ADB1FF|nr:ABC transporter permease [Oscillibacter sp.]
MTNLLTRAVMMSTPLLLGAMAEVFAERTGMMITAIEGIFLMGAWGGFVGVYLSGSVWMGLLVAMLCGLATAALYGAITVHMRQQQIVTGTAINILAAGFCAYFQRVLFGIPTTPLKIAVLPKIAIPVLSQIPVLGPVLFNQNALTYLAYLIIPLAWYLLFHTSLGLTIRSTGENPEAVDVAGINVSRVRFLTVLVAGMVGGLAGSFYTVGYLGMFSTNIIGGRGWIAFAICFLGNWSPKGAVIGTIVFGLADAVSIYIQSAGGNPLFPNELVIALPYILTILLTVTRKNFNVPAKLGIPYAKED